MGVDQHATLGVAPGCILVTRAIAYRGDARTRCCSNCRGEPRVLADVIETVAA